MTATPIRGLPLLLLAAVPLLGCGSAKRSVTFHDPDMDFSLVQTVVVMPFGNLTSVQVAAERVRDVTMIMLQASGGVYVVPPGEVARAVSRAGVQNPSAPTPDEVITLAKQLKADVILTGTVLEYGEVRSGSTASNVATVSVRMLESQSGKVVFSASTTRGGVSTVDRMFGGGGEPMEQVTEDAVRDLLGKLYEAPKARQK